MERLLTLRNILPYFKAIFWPSPENNFRPIFIQRRFLAFYVLLFLALKLVIFPFYFLLPQTSFFAQVVSSSLVELTNHERQSIGLNSLKVNPVLARAALAKAQDMMSKGYFSHTSPQGVTPWYWFKTFGYDYKVAGENLAIGFVDSEEVSRAWKSSPSHYQNIMSAKYKEVGIAVVTGKFQGKNTTLVVQFFGQPKTSQALAAKTLAQSKPVLSPAPDQAKPEPTTTSAVAVLGQEKQLEKDLTVLAEEKTVIRPDSPSSNWPAEIVNFSATQYDQLASQLINLFLIFLVLFLIFSLIFSMTRGVKSLDLLLDASLFIVLLFVSGFLDKQLIISLIPHQLII